MTTNLTFGLWAVFCTNSVLWNLRSGQTTWKAFTKKLFEESIPKYLLTIPKILTILLRNCSMFRLQIDLIATKYWKYPMYRKGWTFNIFSKSTKKIRWCYKPLGFQKIYTFFMKNYHSPITFLLKLSNLTGKTSLIQLEVKWKISSLIILVINYHLLTKITKVNMSVTNIWKKW
jgi:hypothetical protein